jgi:hypothetical protein
MPFNVNDFVSSLSRHGTLQTNKFEVEIPLPEIIRGGYPREILTLRTDRVRIPGIVLDNIETRRYGIGPVYKTATNVRFEPINMSFIETSKSEIHSLFYSWIRLGVINFSQIGGRASTESSRAPNFLTEYKENYVKDITIKVFNNAGQGLRASSSISPSLELKLIEAFPISISDNDLSWGDTNTLYKVNVSFAYSYHQMIEN